MTWMNELVSSSTYLSSLLERTQFIPNSAKDVVVTTLADTLLNLLAPFGTYSASDLQAQRVMTYSPRYRLAFSLLNEDAASGNAALAWDVDDVIESEP